MASPIRVFSKAWEVSFTEAQVAEIRAEAALHGETASDVVRRAVTAYFQSSNKKSKGKAS